MGKRVDGNSHAGVYLAATVNMEAAAGGGGGGSTARINTDRLDFAGLPTSSQDVVLDGFDIVGGKHPCIMWTNGEPVRAL